MRKKILSFISLLSLCFIALLSACTSSKSDNGNNNSSKETETSEEHQHTYASTYTYDDNGHWYKSTCGHDLKKDYAKHTYSNWTITKEATETSNGEKMRTCSVCGYSQSETIDKLEHVHTYSTDFEYNESTHWHASTCGHDVIAGESAHEFTDWGVVKYPTTSSEGIKSRACKVCNYSETSTISKLESHTIIWKNYDGTILETDSLVEVNTTPTYDGETPSKPSDETYTYTFAGWTPTVSKVSEDTVYTATYTANYIDYTITFVNDDNKVISTKTYHYGDTVVEPTAPTKESDNEYNYTFLGWDKEVSTVTGNNTYKAIYTKSNVKYTITFKDYDGTIISTSEYNYGDEITKPQDPTRDSDNTYTYTFAGWNPTVSEVSEDCVYTATYTANYIDYTITFVNDDNKVLSTKTYHYGDTVVEPTTPTKESDNEYNYTFLSWDKEISTVTGNTTYKACYTKTNVKYSVVFNDYDGTIILTCEYNYGEEVTKPQDPTRDSDNTYTYTFAGWNPEVNNVTSNITYTATYTATYIEYTVKFVNYDNTILSTKAYHYGDSIVTPTTPTKPSTAEYVYIFAGWDKEICIVSSDETYMAIYTPSKRTYEITFKDYDGTYLMSKYYEYGSIPTYDSIPSRDSDKSYSYTFVGWSPTIVEVSGEAIYIAKYTKTLIEYTITFYDEDGTTVLSQDNYNYGDIVVVPTPSKENTKEYIYTFVGWDKTVTTVVSDASYIAKYSSAIQAYTITWLNYDNSTIKSETYNYGDTVVEPETPTREKTTKYSYEFNGWTPAITSVCDTATYTATFNEITNKYNVTFVSNGGEEVGTLSLDCDSLITIKPEYTNKTLVGWYDSSDNKIERVPEYDVTLYAKWIDYEINLTYDEITYVSINQTINDELFNATALDTDGNTLDCTYSIISGKFEAGKTISVRILVNGKYDNKVQKTITGIKVYGIPTLTYSLNVEEINITDINLDIFNATALDSFNNSIDINYEVYKDTLKGGKFLSFRIYAYDVTGNLVEEITNPIKVYSQDDIKITYTLNTKNIKVTSNGEEFNASATNSFGDILTISLKAQEGYTIEAGKTACIYIVATDKFNNQSYVNLNDIKIYDTPRIVFSHDIDYINKALDTVESLFTVYDSFNNEIYYEYSVIEGSLDDEYITYNIFAKDNANNTISKDFKLQVFNAPSGYSIIYLYENDNYSEAVVVNNNDFTLPKKDNVNVNWQLADGTKLVNDDGTKLASISLADGVYKAYTYYYTITYKIDGGLEYGYLDEDDYIQTVNYGATLNLYTPKNSYYKFENWSYNNEKYVSTTYDFKSNISLIANYSTCIHDFYYGVCKTCNYSIKDCDKLVVPNSATSIGDRAFYGCSSLISITIPDSVTRIGSYAFKECSSSIYNEYDNAYYLGNENNPYLVLIKSISTSITSLSINSKCSIIYEYAFYNCSSLTSVAIPESVTRIGSSAFYKCSSLTSIIIPESVTSIGSSAFSGCSSLTSITIPDSVTSIGSYAFSGCSVLTSITIPNNITSIGEGAFYNCSSLTSITIPNSVTSIGISAFYKCTSLKEITLPFVGGSKTSNTYLGYIFGASSYSNNSSYVPTSLKEVTITKATSIGSSAFYNCSSLTSITIPNSVTSIGISAFYKCSNLKTIYYSGSNTYWNKISIGSNNNSLSNATIYYYSETQPTDTTYKYWHYVDGVVTIW